MSPRCSAGTEGLRWLLIGCVLSLAGSPAAVRCDPAPDASAAIITTLPQIQVEGWIESIDPAALSLVLRVEVATMPDGEAVLVRPNRLKTVFWNSETRFGDLYHAARKVAPLDLTPGMRVCASGDDFGVGKALPAHQIELCEPRPGPRAAADHRPHPLRRPNAAHPLKIWMGGDSLSLAPAGMLRNLAGKTGEAVCKIDSMNSTGLASATVRDWLARFRTLVDTWDPDVAVVLLGASDPRPIQLGPKALPFASRKWRREYARRVHAAMDTLASSGRMVLWVGVPVMRETGQENRNEAIRLIDRIFMEAAASHPGVVYVDSWRLFSTSSGAYAASLPGIGDLRTPDGIHFSYVGALRLAKVLFARIDERWRLSQSLLASPSQPGVHQATGAGAHPAPTRLVVDARLTEAAVVPGPASIAPYRSALAIDKYEVQSVLDGACSDRVIAVARWGILDALVTPRPVSGQLYHLTLDRFDDHDELESQPVFPDIKDAIPALYFEVESEEAAAADAAELRLTAGEIRVRGVVTRVDSAGLDLNVTSITLPGRSPLALSPVRRKRVLLTRAVTLLRRGAPGLTRSDLQRGVLLTVVGPDAGPGQPLAARIIEAE